MFAGWHADQDYNLAAVMAISESHSIAPPEKKSTRPIANWIWMGLAVSIPLHAVLIAVLARIPIQGGIGDDGDGLGDRGMEVVLFEAPPLEPSPLSSSTGEEASPDVSAGPETAAVQGTTNFGLPEATGNSDEEAAVAIAGASGVFSAAGGAGGSGGAGVGAGSGTTFFGVSGRGKMVGYVVDKSGSMGVGGRIHQAMGELDRSISALPDFASICIALFDDSLLTIDPESGFLKCRESTMQRVRAWLRQVAPGGGTNPVPAFKFLFSRAEHPDVVFFMTDGEFPADSAEEILRMNRRGPNTVIHCIAYGQAAATASLRRIAAETGGTFSVTGAPQK